MSYKRFIDYIRVVFHHECTNSGNTILTTYCFFPLELMVDVFATTSISLDTTYTAKAVQGLLGELRKNPSRFQGKNVLFIHTG